ncbi:MAG: ABC transporter permease [Actinomycetota bacterium]
MKTQDAEVRVNEPSARTRNRLTDVFKYRELLTNLVRKELKVKYKNSVLGFVWSMLNPALYLIIFYIVFTYFLGAAIPKFAIYLLSGLLGWNLWSASLGGSVASLLGNANLVTKVYFPREILPLSTIGASLMHFFFQFGVLLIALVIFRHPVGPEALILVPTALVVELVLIVGVSLILSVLNVYFRDVGHLLELLLLAWFWMTPIVYPIAFPQERLGDVSPLLFRIYLLNPMTSIVLAFQRGIYRDINPVDAKGTVQHILIDAPLSWYMGHLAVVGVAAVVLVAVGWSIFRRLESRLAEEL